MGSPDMELLDTDLGLAACRPVRDARLGLRASQPVAACYSSLSHGDRLGSLPLLFPDIPQGLGAGPRTEWVSTKALQSMQHLRLLMREALGVRKVNQSV